MVWFFMVKLKIESKFIFICYITNGIKCWTLTPFFNPNPINRWYGIKNVARVRVNWERCMALLGQWHPNQHHSARFHWKSLPRHLASLRPCGQKVICEGLGNTFPQPIGYIIIRVQVDGVQGYDEDQIALIVPDLSTFVAQVPVILGTPTIGCVMNMIREKEMDALVTPWINAHVAYLLVVWWMTTTLEDDKVTTRVLDSTEYNKVVTTKGSKTIDTFSSRIIHAQMKITFTGVRLNVMTHVLCAEEVSLPQGLMIKNAYTEMCNGSKNVTGIVRNSIAYPQTLKKILVARVVAANWVPEP